MRARYLFSFFLFSYLCGKAQLTRADYYNTIDNKVYTFSKQKPDASFDTIVGFVNTTFSKQEDKARAYYTWINSNVKFDEDFRGSSSYFLIKGLRDSNNVLYRESSALETRKAASEGFADLMMTFCRKSGIVCYTVPGYLRRPDQSISDMSHVWNLLLIDSGWVQVDASITQGYLAGDYKFIKYPVKNYFGLSADNFVKDHFPHDPMWQLLDHPYSEYDFETGSPKSSVKQSYSFKDSLKAYRSKTFAEQKNTDIVRYFRYESDKALREQNLEFYNYDQANDKMAESIEYYYKYYDIGENKLSKYPLRSDWVKAKKWLDKSEVYFKEAELLMLSHPPKTSDAKERYDTLRSNMDNNRINIQKNQQYLEKLKPFLKGK